MKNLFFIVSALFLFVLNPIFAQDEIVSPFAGSWYPPNKEFLQLQIEKYLNNVKSRELNNVIALIIPHAGYIYSGQTAAYGIKELIGKKYSRIVIIGPSHHSLMKNKFSVPDVKLIKTPLGAINIDKDFITKLKAFPEYAKQDYTFHRNEHSIQIELPFLQSVLTNFKIVPIIVGRLDANTINKVAVELKPMLDKDTLVIISSDFTHYGNNYDYVPFPADDSIETNLKNLDMEAVNYILKLNYKGLSDFIEKTEDTICGICGIELLLHLLPKNAKSHMLNYETSGKVIGDFSNSVSYTAIAFTGSWKCDSPDSAIQIDKNNLNDKKLSEKDKTELLCLAKKAIEYFLDNDSIPSPDDLKIKVSEPMKEKRGVFVTLKKKDELRGCIGEIFPTQPLYKAVIKEAINSAFMDSRFYSVQKSELPELNFEISVLTVPKKVNSWKDIVIGRDGIILKKDGHSALFLPQVAPEQEWDIEQTLSHLARKAGLPSSKWRDAEFLIFQAEVFSLNSDSPLK